MGRLDEKIMRAVQERTRICRLLCLLPLIWIGLWAAAETYAADGSAGLRIAVASDLHLDPGNMQKGAVNPLVPYNEEITEALLWDVLEQKADVLLLLGDVTNSGRSSQHEAVLEKLKAASEKGLTILVLPGNHDIGEVKTDAFARMYESYGYGDAVSRDPASLSYSFRIGSVLFLMLDTGGYSGSVTTARLTDPTLDWIREQIRSAKEQGLEVIPAGHYSFLQGQTTSFIGAETMIRILKEEALPLTLCGHLHQRCVASDGKLHELVVEAATAYPCSYALLEYEEGYRIRYTPRITDVESWANQQKEIGEELIGFEAFKKKVFEEKCADTVEVLSQKNPASSEDKAEALTFFIDFQEAYAQGCLYEAAEELKARKGYELFMSLAEGTVYAAWTPVALETTVPQTMGFVLEAGVFADEEPMP